MRPNKHKGIFILVEGLDGAGKTTAIKSFLNGGNKTGASFSYMKGAATKTFLQGFARRHPHTALFLAELLWTTFGSLREKLRRGENVIMDKYFFFIASHVPDVNRPLNKLLLSMLRPLMLKPDLVIYFTVDSNERLARLRQGEPNPHHNRLIEKPALIDQRERVYRWLTEQSGCSTIVLDTTTLTVDQMAEKLNKIVKNFLPPHAEA